MKPLKILVLIEKGPTSYGVSSPDIPGCYAGGDTRQEALRLFEEAVQEHVNYLFQNHRPLPWVLKTHLWRGQLHALISWIREHFHRKEEVAHVFVTLAG